MTGRIVLVFALAFLPAARGEVAPLDVDPASLTWRATHIVLVEGDQVVESWKGDLKPGDKLPEGAARYARVRPPAFDPDWVRQSGQKPPAVSGKRVVLFLAYVPRYREEEHGPVWMGAECPGFPARPNAANVAFVEGDQVYTAVGVHGTGGYALRPAGTLAGLKEQVGLGLDLRARFEAAQKDADPERRADRLAALVPTVAAYSTWGPGDAMEALGRCGKAGARHLVRWVGEPRGKYRDEALGALCRAGDAGVDGVLAVLDDAARYWRAGAAREPAPAAARSAPPAPWETGIGLYHLLGGVRAMKLSADNQKRVREHPAPAELDRVLGAWSAEAPDLARARRVLEDIRAGKLGAD